MAEHIAKQTQIQMIQAASSAAAPQVGKQTLVSALGAVQAKGGGVGEAGVHAAAAAGTATAATKLPFHDQIQRSFGAHDISGVQAHVGKDAAASAQAMGAQAYASGDHVVLSNPNDLHTAAHEAAHVVQQRGGVQLKGGVGQAGDSYEQNADAVADRVVQGKSAEDLLGPARGASAPSTPSVQHRILNAKGEPFASFAAVEAALTSSAIALSEEERAALRGLFDDGQDHAFNEALETARGDQPGTATIDGQALPQYLAAHPQLQQQLQVPHVVHFIWSGRPISSAALANVQAWAALMKGTDWKVNIWTDQNIHNWGLLVRGKLKMSGVNLRYINQDVVDPRLWPDYQRAMNREHTNYPAASDLARYSILNQQGGIYIDVDIAPGEMSFANGAMSLPTPLPQLAPEIRDSRAVREEMRIDDQEPITKDLVRATATRRMEKGQFNNNFIATAPGSPAMEAIIQHVQGLLARVGGGDALREMPDLTATITGPNAVTNGLVQYIMSVAPQLSLEQVIEVLKRAVSTPHNLDWVTPESESQEH